ncbi:SnoaL-like domain protein [bacterium YEK0313]|nr:SnoaL-like domain protein [bacterium YEK0313]
MPSSWTSSLAAAALMSLLPVAAEAGPKEEAQATLTAWEAAFNAGDADAVARFYLPDATVHGLVSSTLIVGEDALRRYFAAPLKARARIAFGDTTLQELAGDTVVATGYEEASAMLPDGRAISIPGRYTFVLVRRDGAWRIAHQHSSSRFRPQ